MNTHGRQLETEVAGILAAELEFANDAQRQNRAFDEATRRHNSNMGRSSTHEQDAVRNRIRAAFNPDSSYRGAWNRFTEFVKQKRESGEIVDGDLFLTRDSVDLFFATYVSSLNVTSRHAKRFACALKKYADNVEHVGEKFVVLSDAVRESLDAQKNFKQDQDSIVRAKRPGNKLPCPHMGLRVNLCTPKEGLRMMEYIYLVDPEGVCHRSVEYLLF